VKNAHLAVAIIRERARKAQGEDPQLQAFRPKAQAMIVSQYNKILVPANFSPLK
jgi:NIPSNAP protein